jgi:hypothetical protein
VGKRNWLSPGAAAGHLGPGPHRKRGLYPHHTMHVWFMVKDEPPVGVLGYEPADDRASLLVRHPPSVPLSPRCRLRAELLPGGARDPQWGWSQLKTHRRASCQRPGIVFATQIRSPDPPGAPPAGRGRAAICLAARDPAPAGSIARVARGGPDFWGGGSRTDFGPAPPPPAVSAAPQTPPERPCVW